MGRGTAVVVVCGVLIIAGCSDPDVGSASAGSSAVLTLDPTSQRADPPVSGVQSTASPLTCPDPVTGGCGVNHPPAAARFEVSPQTLTVGNAVTFSGNGCLAPGRVKVGVPVDGEPQLGATTAEVSTDIGGNWSITVPVSDSTVLGTVLAGAGCVDPTSGSVVFGYQVVPVVVTTFRSLDVSPGASIAAGQSLEIASRGGCPAFSGQRDEPNASIETSTMTVAVSDPQTVTIEPDGNWRTTLFIPRSATPGQYVLHAYCAQSRQIEAHYPDLPITVTAAA